MSVNTGNVFDLNNMGVKILNQGRPNGLLGYHCITAGLKEATIPLWRMLSKEPLTKRIWDLQWGVLHGIVAVNFFISVLSLSESHICPEFTQRSTMFLECHRLSPLVLIVFLRCLWKFIPS